LGLPAQPEEGGDLGQVPPDLDQTFSSVLQAQAELIQSAAELGVVHSYNQTPKQMVEEFEKLDPNINRTFSRLAAQAPAVKPTAIWLWPNLTFVIATSSRRSTASSRAETSMRAIMFRSGRI